jgi:hypothetical protein
VFEGQSILVPSHEVYGPILLVWALGMLATLLLRVRFDREWNLTMWTVIHIKRVWQRLSDESARTGGTLTSHAMGLLAWSLCGGVWAVTQTPDTPAVPSQVWTGCALGALSGLIALIVRTAGAWLGGWITLEQTAVKRGLEIDRHMRNWLLWSFMVLFFLFLIRNPGFTIEQHPFRNMLMLWWAWIGLKWLRQLQVVVRSSLHFRWGIAYICTFEIGPTWILYREFFG